ncbi:hypothetical protein B2I21_00800 [Chryseobacterium mucoviscidosis]|nr:hypothetical protein B2I21_00800 [Chryseobacterium mucoviscidosis]
MNNAGNVIAANLQTRIGCLPFYFTPKKALFQAIIPIRMHSARACCLLNQLMLTMPCSRPTKKLGIRPL